ncbi:hypothetical protein PIROE2DRAFT_10225 [Piromyces sp. E2]|nr:hypothetical protein PIROE2DRAFT_10225 [Piromyces sp. E2]|eukprot:OUM63259.1 hypothetical protein PIROE2DRAFT_10225 [Piromyces sp. E2]
MNIIDDYYLINKDINNVFLYYISNYDNIYKYEESDEYGVFLFQYREDYIKKIDQYNHYALNEDDCTNSNFRIYECQKGRCEITQGYARCGSDQLLNCSKEDCVIVNNVYDELICNESNYEKAFVENEEFKICILINEEEGYEFRQVPVDNESFHIYTYYTNYNNDFYKLYISYQNGNILRLSTSKGNYYETLNQNDDYENKKMIICNDKKDDPKCYITNKSGYYYNTIGDESQKLLKCNQEDDYICETPETIENGYFYNPENTDVIKCFDDKCEYYNPGNSCSNENYDEIIVESNAKYYCHNNQKYTIGSDDKYYSISDINAEDIYPNLSEGNDIILIKVSPYSITQYIKESGEGWYK